jgi:CRP-like cAMP-binding protein
MENLERLLREHRFLDALDAAQIQFLVSCARNIRVHAGQFLFREGAVADTMYLVRHGSVALEVHVPGKGPIVLETTGPGDVVGFSWLLPPHLTHLDARAREEVVALAFDGPCLRAKMDSDPVLGHALSRRLLEQLYRRLERARMQRLDIYRVE